MLLLQPNEIVVDEWGLSDRSEVMRQTEGADCEPCTENILCGTKEEYLHISQ